MDSYKETIKNHQKLDLNEVKMFLDEQINTYELKNYIEGISYKNDLLGCAEYNLNTKYIYLSDDYDLDLKAELLRLPKNKFLTTILYNNDIYNLSIINSIFHELRHAYQKKIVDTDHTSLQSLLFSLNFALICSIILLFESSFLFCKTGDSFTSTRFNFFFLSAISAAKLISFD